MLPGECALNAAQTVLPEPTTSPRMADISGAREQAAFQANFGVLRCTGLGPRTTPPDADAAGYTYWHRGKCRAPSGIFFST